MTKTTSKKEKKSSKKIKLNLLQMLQAGVHFGHQVSRWHPSMKEFIFAEKKGVHIINLEKTLKKLDHALKIIEKTIKNKEKILFIGTKKQVQKKIKELADETNMPYVNQKWIGGTITNWPVIKKQILKLQKTRKAKEKNEWAKYTKKERVLLNRELKKLEEDYGGIANLEQIPAYLFVANCKENKTAIAEANIKNVPIIAITDTNVNIKKITHPIPANDDAVKSLNFILDKVKETILKAQENKVNSSDVPKKIKSASKESKK